MEKQEFKSNYQYIPKPTPLQIVAEPNLPIQNPANPQRVQNNPVLYPAAQQKSGGGQFQSKNISNAVLAAALAATAIGAGVIFHHGRVKVNDLENTILNLTKEKDITIKSLEDIKAIEKAARDEINKLGSQINSLISNNGAQSAELINKQNAINALQAKYDAI